MKPYYLFIFIIIFSLYGCEDKKTSEYYETPDIEMFTNDSIDLSKYSSDLGLKCAFSEKTDLFGLYKGKLFVKDLSKIKQKQNYLLKINGHEVKVKVKFWIEDKYSLELLDSDCKYRILLTKGDTTFFLDQSKLYYSVGNMSNKTFCADLPYNYPLYTELIADGNLYAYRTMGEIYVSQDLKNWRRIYSDKRGIKSSMVIVGDKKRLLFIEYSPGKERLRHHIYSYDFDSNKLQKKYTFYSSTESIPDTSCIRIRHIHVIDKDPYTGDIYVGTGDADNESMILRSTDDGDNFHILGGGSQLWRSLSFIFTPTDVFWNTDSDAPQFLTRLSKEDVRDGILIEDKLVRFPLTNSALWCTTNYQLDKNTQMVVMSSNNEGGIYDNYCRTYGIIIKNRLPIVYELYKIPARIIYTQLFPLGVDNEGKIYLCNVENLKISVFRLKQ